MSGVPTDHPDRARWDAKYLDPAFDWNWTPSPQLLRALPDLPRGRALDVAAGHGRHARLLARKGYTVDAIDASGIAVSVLRAVAALERLPIHAHHVDAPTWTPLPDAYALVVNTNYLDRSLSHALARALAPGGVLFFETWNVGHLKYKPDFHREFLLKPGELPTLFPTLRVIDYRETDDGTASFSTLLAERTG